MVAVGCGADRVAVGTDGAGLVAVGFCGAGCVAVGFTGALVDVTTGGKVAVDVRALGVTANSAVRVWLGAGSRVAWPSWLGILQASCAAARADTVNKMRNRLLISPPSEHYKAWRNKLYNYDMMDASTPGSASSFIDHLDVRVVVFSLRSDTLQVLLDPTADNLWELPGSAIPSDQSLEETATESLLRMTGLREAYLEQLYTYGDSARFDVKKPSKRLISVVYFAIIPAGNSGASADTSHKRAECQSQWFAVDALPALAQDHPDILLYALRRLRYKLEYTAVGFQLLPEQFSLSELQKVYEMILGEKLDKRNFRRRILEAGIIEETPHLRSGEGRPARLYRYQPDAVAEVKVRRLFP
jgi:8-oxo-dGTP diphosphatase